MKRRVVVTGLGLVTSCGNDVPSTWSAMMAGQNGADYIKKFDPENLVPVCLRVKISIRAAFLIKRTVDGLCTHFARLLGEAVRKSGW